MPTQTVAFRLPEELCDALDYEAALTGQTRSALIRQLVREHLETPTREESDDE